MLDLVEYILPTYTMLDVAGQCQIVAVRPVRGSEAWKETCTMRWSLSDTYHHWYVSLMVAGTQVEFAQTHQNLLNRMFYV